MKRILLITNLFPAYEGESRKVITYALYQFVAEWNKLPDVSVKVIKIFSLRKLLFSLRRLINGSIKLDWHKIGNVDIYNQFLPNIPKTRVTLFRRTLKNLLIHALQKQNFTPDIVIAHMYISFDLAYRISQHFNAELVLGFHMSDVKWLSKRNNNREKVRKYMNAAKKIACRSKPIYKKIAQIFPEYKDKMFTAYSGISENLIEDKKFFIRKSIFSNQEIIFSTAAALIPLKNIDINLRALARFKNKSWKYYVMGDGECITKLKKLTCDLGIADKVIFTGYMEHQKVLEKLKETHVFIMVSAPETFGLAYLEAMAKANIVIGAKGWGIDGIIKDSFNGFLVEPRNTEKLSAVLDKIFNMSEKEKREILLNTWITVNKYTDTAAAMNYLENIGCHEKSRTPKFQW